MKTSALQVGQLVRSTAGRDQGRLMFVVDIIDDRHIAVADGDLRRIESPKKKNIRHVRKRRECDRRLAERIRRDQVTNGELREALIRYGGGVHASNE